MAPSLLGQTTKRLGNTYLQGTSILFNTKESGNFSINLIIRHRHTCCKRSRCETMRTEPSKNRFFLITQPAEPQVGCCLATLLVLLASLLVLLVLLGSVLGQLAALWRQPLIRSPHCDTNQHGQAFCQQDFCALLESTCGKRKKRKLPLTLCCKPGSI